MTIPLAGVLGSPIKHSKSPLIHNTWLKTLNLKGLYAPIDVSSEDLGAFVRLAPRLGFVGFNVTIPHKEAIAQICTAQSETARKAGSVNTISFDEKGEPFGDSTDGYGFLKNLEEKVGWSPKNGSVAMFGAGGAARAVAAALISGGAKELRLTNRSADRAVELAQQVGGNVTCHDWSAATNPSALQDFVRETDLIINATSLGMEGGPSWNWALPELGEKTVATDLIYAPLKTPFLLAAEAQGATIVDGLGMLLHQAVPGFERWFGVRPQVSEALRRVVLEGEGALP